jgi:hypothetical protein
VLKEERIDAGRGSCSPDCCDRCWEGFLFT